MTQQVARVFEAGITEHPEDWHMLQRVFSADLDLARLAAAQATTRAAEESEADAADTADAADGGAERDVASRMALNGQVDGAALDGLSGGAGEGGSGP
jgi:hypothetical protein